MKADKKQLKLIEELSDARGASGFEDEVLLVARKAMKGIADIDEDSMRNLYLYRKSNTGNKPVVMLDAHSDEVGFMVHSIRPNGTLRVVNLGGWTIAELPSSKVFVRNAKGEYLQGIVASKPKHFATDGDSAASAYSDLSIDIGARSIDEAKNDFHIRIGEPIVPAAKFEYDEKHDLMFGKAFDCRIGCAVLLETLKRLDGVDLPVDVVGVLSSQEEVGERGCKVSVNRVKPDVALCLEGCPADDTFTESYAIQTALKKGPMLRHMDVSVICNPRLQRFCLDLAAKKKIAVQESVREGGGNDAAITTTSLQGIPSITAGVPVRYIHAMNCITSYFDYESTVQLMVEIIKNLSADIIKSF